MPTSIAPSAILSPIDQTRKMGFEFECGIPRSISHAELANRIGLELRSQGITRYGAGNRAYGHTRSGNSDVLVKPDSSLRFRNYYGAEVVTPVLQGEDTYRVIRAILKTLNGRTSASVNKSCGFHLHLDVADYSLTDWKAFICRYLRAERRIFSTIAPSRFYGHFSVPLFRQLESRMGFNSPTSDCLIERYCREIWDCNSLRDIYSLFGHTRYTAINIEPVATGLRTAIEFRMHNGTLCPDKAIAWAEFWLAFIGNAKNSESRYRPVAENYGNRRAYLANCVIGTSTRPSRIVYQNWAFLNSRRQALKTAHDRAGADWNRGHGNVYWNTGNSTWEHRNTGIQFGTGNSPRQTRNTRQTRSANSRISQEGAGADNSAPDTFTVNSGMTLSNGICNLTPRTDTVYYFNAPGRFQWANDFVPLQNSDALQFGFNLRTGQNPVIEQQYNCYTGGNPMRLMVNGIETIAVPFRISSAWEGQGPYRLVLVPDNIADRSNNYSGTWTALYVTRDWQYHGIACRNIPCNSMRVLMDARIELSRWLSVGIVAPLQLEGFWEIERPTIR